MRERYGKNELTPPRRKALWRQYLEKYNDPIIRILLVAILISPFGDIRRKRLCRRDRDYPCSPSRNEYCILHGIPDNREFEALNSMREDTGLK